MMNIKTFIRNIMDTADEITETVNVYVNVDDVKLLDVYRLVKEKNRQFRYLQKISKNRRYIVSVDWTNGTVMSAQDLRTDVEGV